MFGIDEDGLFTGESLREARVRAFNNSQEAHRRSAQIFDQGRKDPEFQPGEPVYVMAKHQLNRKRLEPRYVGPNAIVERLGHTSYNLNKDGQTEQHHVSQLKPTKKPAYSPKGPSADGHV